jgi:iron complex outermembrane receptor protein
MSRSALLGLTVLTLIARVAWGTPSSGGISGMVVDPGGQGMPGAAIVVRTSGGAEPLRVVSGYGGIFRITSLVPGSYSIEARLEGLAPAGPASLTVRPGETVSVRLAFAKAVYHEMVEVTAEHGAMTVTEVRESGARDVGEALAGVAGVAVVRKGGIANDIALRGLQRDNVNVLIDGERIHGGCPNRMDAPAFHVDFSEIEHVEVTKGPFDIENQGSLGGVVNIVTRKAEPGIHGTIAFVGGSYGFANPSLAASHGGEKVAVAAGYSYRASGPFRDAEGRRITEITNYAAGALDSSSFGVGTAWGKLYATPGRDHSFELAYTRQEADRVIYPGLQMDAGWDNTDRVSLAWRKTRNAGALRSVRVRAYGTRVRHWMTDELRLSGVGKPLGWSMGSMAEASTLGGRADAEVAGFKVGAEVIRRGWDMTTQMAGMNYSVQASIPDVATTVAGVFVRRAVALGKAFNLTLGARLDSARSSADPTRAATNLYYAYNATRSTSWSDTLPAGSLRLAWSPTARLSLSSGLGRTVRLPDPAERYLGLKRMGTDWVGNPDLRPTRNTGADLQLAWRHDRGSLSVSGFRESLQDWIAVHSQPRVNTVTGVMNVSARSYANVDARMWGGEVEATHAISGRLFLAGSLAVVRGDKSTDPARQVLSPVLGEIPALSSRLSVRWDTGRIHAEAEALLAGAQRRVDSDLQELATPGWSVFNLKLGGTLAGGRVQVMLANALNREYTEHLAFARDPFRSGVRVYEPGRSFTVSVVRRF